MRKILDRKNVTTFFVTYGVLLTFMPYVNCGVGHLRAVLFSLVISLAATLGSALFPARREGDD